MSTTTRTPRRPFDRKKSPIDLGPFGVFEIGKLTKHRQDRIEQLGEEMESLQTETISRIAPPGTTDEQLEQLRTKVPEMVKHEDSTVEQRDAEAARVKAAEQVHETRFVGILCEQIETMLLARDETTGKLGPAEDLATQLEHAYRDPDVDEENALGLEEIMAVLDMVMEDVEDEKAAGNG